MATMKDIKKGICDEAYTELEGMKERLEMLREKFRSAYPIKDELSVLYERHLLELAEQIDWKLQIISHACPYDWKGSVEYEENVVSVGPAPTKDVDFSGGYLGG